MNAFMGLFTRSKSTLDAVLADMRPGGWPRPTLPIEESLGDGDDDDKISPLSSSSSSSSFISSSSCSSFSLLL
ncbi:hypothetical protein BpHYR1_051035 [Brachionus plicatilis]|uniref:Uncharacterized protein n=1 Tax=Brachionus plicatilis TaxID=10195 RepID=A0A3M7SR43_BRAPC|nr:hypothetical protein BpHYR1_051035 [Brachionus plicatilis]